MAADRTAGAATAGALLRAAREKHGMHVAALAASIKIPQRKLEALEADRLDELPDAAFARALAMTVCRALKIDAAPVLALLPSTGAKALADVRGGLNTPFRERPGRADPAESSVLRHPLVWAALLVLAAALVLYFLPAGWWSTWLPRGSESAAAPEASVASAPLVSVTLAPAASAASQPAMEAATAPAAVDVAASAPAVEVVHAAPAPDTSASVAEVIGGLALLRASEDSWVEVVDASGQVLVQRVLQPGESLGLDGKLPMKLKIGNAAATQLSFRGQRVDLGPATRDNVARLELK
jgi:cytoskeleton protein RodZ